MLYRHHHAGADSSKQPCPQFSMKCRFGFVTQVLLRVAPLPHPSAHTVAATAAAAQRKKVLPAEWKVMVFATLANLHTLVNDELLNDLCSSRMTGALACVLCCCVTGRGRQNTREYLGASGQLSAASHQPSNCGCGIITNWRPS